MFRPCESPLGGSAVGKQGLLPGLLLYAGQSIAYWRKHPGNIKIPKLIRREIFQRFRPNLARKILRQVVFLVHRAVLHLNKLEFFLDRTLALFQSGQNQVLENNKVYNSLLIAVYLSLEEKKSICPRDLEPIFPRKGNSFSILKTLGDRDTSLVEEIKKLKTAEIPEVVESLPLLRREAIMWSHPIYYLEKLHDLLPSEAQVRATLQFNNERDSFFLRVHTSRISIQNFREWCGNQSILLIDCPNLQFLFKVSLEDRTRLLSHPKFFEGVYVFQELASVLTCVSVNPKPEDLIIEVGAAPFMKTSLILQLAGNPDNPRIVSIDYSRTRVQQNIEIFDQWGFVRPSILVADGTSLPLRPLMAKFLLDAPCTASGALASMPEMKWQQSPAYVQSHVVLQECLLREILQIALEGSWLTYAVCSIYPEEGEKQIEKIKTCLTDLKEGRTWPHENHTEGFFYATARVIKPCN